jgi:hypothetical protein
MRATSALYAARGTASSVSRPPAGSRGHPTEEQQVPRQVPVDGHDLGLVPVHREHAAVPRVDDDVVLVAATRY